MNSKFRNRLLLILSVVVLGAWTRVAGAQEAIKTWSLPLQVNDENTKVTFKVDTTWHWVHGKTKGLSGKVTLADQADPMSILSQIRIPANTIDTGWGMRNNSLYDHMGTKDFPDIIWKSTKLAGDCTPAKIAAEKSCKGTLVGSLTIRDVTTDENLPVTIELKDDEFHVTGAITFRWAIYHVEDPSMIGASVEPEVTVEYEIVIPAK